MVSWQEEYLSALRDRDRTEKFNKPMYDAYTKLAHRAAHLDALIPNKSLTSSSLTVAQTAKTNIVTAPHMSTATGDALTRTRQDLSEAQRSKGVMQSRLELATEELQKRKLQSQLDNKRIGELTTERASLTTRMRDQDEELKGKGKLLEDVHDENLSLTLQLNVAEEQSQKLKRENKELVDRWMTRVGEEAEALNKASKFS